jgi:putative hemolysin
MAKEIQHQIISIRDILREKAPAMSRKIPSFLIQYLERIIHQDEINYILRRLGSKEGIEAMTQLVDYFGIRLNHFGTDSLGSERYIFASNHPLGGLDGICLASLVGSLFDGKVLLPVNDLLLHLPQLRPIFIPVNKHGRQGRDTVMMTHRAYASDHQIITFPAGLCSRKVNGEITDPEWKKSFIRMAVAYKRNVVPVRFDGKNSSFFYNLAAIRKRLGIRLNLEMLFLADELFKSKGKTFDIYFGEPIPHTTFDKSRSPSEWTQWVRHQACTLKK